MLNTFYRSLSVLLHPIFMMLIGTLVMFNTNTFMKFSLSSEMKQWIYSVLTVNTIVLPGLFALILWRNRYISSLAIPQVPERRVPYLITLLLYLVTLYLFLQFDLPRLIYKYLAGACISIFLLFLLSLMRIKASAHMAGISGLLGGLIFTSLILSVNLIDFIYPTILMCGLLATARLKLKAHKPIEVFAGFFIGLLGQFVMHA